MSSASERARAELLGAFVAPKPRRDAAGNKIKEPRPISTPAEIYARKLRRLTLAALDAPESEWRPRFEALRELAGRDAGYVFCHPGSPTATELFARHAALSDPQYKAVLSFLEWVADGPFSVDDRFAAITGLRHLWTRFGIDEARVSAFYEPFVNYRRPTINEPKAEELAVQIEEAFAETPPPSEVTAASGDESCDVAVVFDGMRWQWLGADYLDIEIAALSFLSAEAFRYYLPAYLLCNVGGQPLNANPVFHLVYGLTEEYRDKREQNVARFELFSRAERAAIVAFLEACNTGLVTNYNRASDIVEALDSYWLPSLD